ncbi:MAG: DEAD/DEAH box helicase [Burkholderiales bacterium]|nr:DEAD/DEAH box helicase [Burkholderiales bacterium]
MSDVNAVPTAGFDSFGLHSDILRAVADQGYTQPTPIQAQAIPIVLAGRDVMGAAQTGTGKTASFSLPIIQRLLAHASTSTSPARHPVRALILTPTRELADQVADNVRGYAQHTALRSTVVFGGVDMRAQEAELRRGVEILIATPGRLLDHVQQRTVDLGQVQILVLDEADRMLDMGFLPDLQRILNLLPKSRQTLLFSATFSGEIKKLAASYLRDPVTIEVARRNATAENVQQVVYEVAEDDKRAAVVQLLRERDLKQVIVFVNSKIGASRLARQLERDGVVTAAIHGDKSQAERMQALEAFKQGGIAALVATDVAARGLDIAELPGVINYDLPYNPEDYVHRIGRTGRAGASGEAISLCAPDERKHLVEIEKLIKRDIPRGQLQLTRASAYHERDGEERRNGRSGSFERRPPRSTRPRHIAPEDEIFYKPYEPAPAKEDEAGDIKATSEPASPKPPKRQLAALLGGVPLKTPRD